MGDYADDEIDKIDSWEGRPNRHRSSRLNSEIPQCKDCGTCDVYWSHTREGWRMFDEDTRKRHDCRKVTVDDFDDLTKG